MLPILANTSLSQVSAMHISRGEAANREILQMVIFTFQCETTFKLCIQHTINTNLSVKKTNKYTANFGNTYLSLPVKYTFWLPHL